MRGDGVGVGDIGEVPGVGGSEGDTAGGDDGRGAGRERECGVDGGRGRDERDTGREPGRDGVGVGDGTGYFQQLKRDIYFIVYMVSYGSNLNEMNIMVTV